MKTVIIGVALLGTLGPAAADICSYNYHVESPEFYRCRFNEGREWIQQNQIDRQQQELNRQQREIERLQFQQQLQRQRPR